MKSLLKFLNTPAKVLITFLLTLTTRLLAHDGHSSTEAIHSSIHAEWIIGLLVLIVISGAIRLFRGR
jgi:putative copper export protein